MSVSILTAIVSDHSVITEFAFATAAAESPAIAVCISSTVVPCASVSRSNAVSYTHLILTGEKLFVSADMSKIEQVLYNLIDNAIKFSHTDSTISFTMERPSPVPFLSLPRERSVL